MISDTVVELVGVNGETVNLTTGVEGFYLATDPQGCFYDPPVKVAFEEPGNYPGAKYLSHRILKRDITFGVHVMADSLYGSDSFVGRDSAWRRLWAFDKDAYLQVTTPDSGTRVLKIRLFESPKVEMYTDPRGSRASLILMSCISYDPFWWEDDQVFSVKTRQDTTFDPNKFRNKLPSAWDYQPKEEIYLTVGDCNPTDQYIAPKWTVPGSTTPIPNFRWPPDSGVEIPWERASYTQFAIPDYSFEDAEFADRRVRTPGLIYGENCVIDSDRSKDMIVSESGSQVWARMDGVRFRNMIPPYTSSKRFNITASGCERGQVITLRLPRPWSRPWGLE